MNIGPCPYDGCNGSFFESVPDRTPAWAKLTCEECGRTVWYKFSRIDPEALTVEDFDAIYVVDEATQAIKKRVPDVELNPFTQTVADGFAKFVATQLDHELAFGTDHRCAECRPPASVTLRGLETLAKRAALAADAFVQLETTFWESILSNGQWQGLYRRDSRKARRRARAERRAAAMMRTPAREWYLRISGRARG